MTATDHTERAPLSAAPIDKLGRPVRDSAHLGH